MRISVVIATCNRASLLATALDQLRLQKYEPHDEVIVVDNGSTDASADVIARAAIGFPVRLRAIREAMPGKSPALNAGIAVAQGDVLALTDDDVMVDADWIVTIRRIFSSSAVSLVGGRVDPRWERPAPRWLRVDQQGTYGRLASPLALQHYGEAQELGSRTAVGANLIVRRGVFEALGDFSVHLGRRAGTLLCGEDHEFCQRVSAAGFRCEYRPELRVRHWVPAERTRLSYFLRWFYWVGITNAVLDRADVHAASRPVVPRYLVRRLALAPMAAGIRLLAGRHADATSSLMDAAFAMGYITQRIKDVRAGGSHRRLRRAA
jgi:GT2 family glycosyltransferase